jgi:endogenous inhibitor of DNA gyrase (YacG/DUF329 family)
MACSATTAKGLPCKKTAKHGTSLCFIHSHDSKEETKGESKQYEPKLCEGVTLKGLPCKKFGGSLGTPFCSHHMPLATPKKEKPLQKSKPTINPAPHPEKQLNSLCFAIDHVGKKQVICTRNADQSSREGRYCSKHAAKYRLSVEDCPICLTAVDEKTDSPLECGHWLHTKCLKQWKNATCPVCRKAMTESEKSRFNHVDYSMVYTTLVTYSHIFRKMMLKFGTLAGSNPVDNLAGEEAVKLVRALTTNTPLDKLMDSLHDNDITTCQGVIMYIMTDQKFQSAMNSVE